ncbi:MAG: T9SS type A sorting domain-containing protein [Bacteroidetes bacterium]|nr:MAG: T9SS type A sorting domain-containing protein [Bacteroidota bacterium]
MISSIKPKPTLSESSNFSYIGFLAVLFVIDQPLFSAGQGVNFELVIGTQKYDDAKCVIQTFDSGYVVVGSTSAFGNGQTDVYLTNISKAGKVAWQQAIGGAGVEKGNSVIQTPDSGFAITGYSNSEGTGGYDVYLAKTDKNGILEWSNSYGGIDWDFGNSIIQTSAGDFVICGSTYSYGNGNGDVYLLKIDPTGVLLWDSAYGGSLEDAGNSVCSTTDGGYFVAGYTKSFGQGEEDVYLLKSDSTGNLKWAKTYGGTGEDRGNECKLTSDGRFIVICAAKSFSALNKYENWLMKINSIGDTLWSRRDAAIYNRIATSVSQTAEGGYVFTGHDDNAGQYNMFLYKTDAGGYYQDYRGYGGAQTENAFSIKQTFDKGYVIVGTTESYGTGKPNIYVLKTDSNHLSTGTVQVVVSTHEIETKKEILSIVPNPASDHFIVNTTESSVIEIYDALGRIVLTQHIATGKNTISVTGIHEGLYFVHVREKNRVGTGKLIVRH